MFKHSIKKAIIPVAGFGTRFLPATKAIPKEMLPILNKPVLQYVVEEVVNSGIKDIIFVTSHNKRACEDHFDVSAELEQILKSSQKKKIYQEIRRISQMANFTYVRQKGPYGNGTPVLNCRNLIGNEPFAVLWGDEVFDCPKEPRLLQQIKVFEKYGDPVLTGYKIKKSDTSKYGVIDGTEVESGVFQVNKIVEKPGPTKAPSLVASLGAYVLTPDIFPILTKTALGKDNELWLVDAIHSLSKKRQIYARLIEGTYYDTGNKLNWLKVNIKFGLKDPEIKSDLRKYLKKLL
jgi:UTP--glucose-1-phosphate uridylyltransferase